MSLLSEVLAMTADWRRSARRPSCLDLITLLRREMPEQPELLEPFGPQITDSGMVRAAAA